MTQPGKFWYDKRAFINTLRRHGIRDEAVLSAMEAVPREKFIKPDHHRFAYDDSPLPIAAGQTISQPSMVAYMLVAMRLKPSDTVLEIGTGSAYAAFVLSRLVKQVYSIERHESLARPAALRLHELGYDNVEVRCGDGTLGWPEHAPFDAIVVTASGPSVPPSLLRQLIIGGHLIIPIGNKPHQQKLFRITRCGDDETKTEELAEVRFVPLLGEEGWGKIGKGGETNQSNLRPQSLSGILGNSVEPISSIDSTNLDALLDRIGDARLVLLGEATHGTAEFYEMRARISSELIERKGINFIAVEADWPDANQIDHFVRATRSEPTPEQTFCRFPTWMWVNSQFLQFLHWLRGYNHKLEEEARVGFYGLDLYSLYASIDSVIAYLDEVDESAAAVARKRYGCLSVWQRDPVRYGRMAFNTTHRHCEAEVIRTLSALLQKQLDYTQKDGRGFLDAVANARLVRNAERYYRAMYQISESCWNLRDRHMVETLNQLFEFHGPRSKAIVWAHNSHLGDATATEMSRRGEVNVGQLCRERFGDDAYLIGFGTDRGTVAAASEWGGELEIKTVRPALPESYERLCHDSGVAAFLLPLRDARADLRKELETPRLERAIGVIYRPEMERASHYFRASLTRQFDEYVWIDETRAVEALNSESAPGLPENFPFGL